MNINYHKKEDALYMRFNDSPIAESDEVREGVILDLDKNDKIVGLEFLDASKRFPRQFASILAKQKLEFAPSA
ncbi:MAG: hypothetical protein G01um101417_653 [Parcubacteria group bacterium Gr01-1014_17]|nr:MAG: hypothetical protein G01um101417_653 [Parcubacteria group bacterium Gr01-1014_17]